MMRVTTDLQGLVDEGWRLHPLGEKGKIPQIKDWPTNASSDMDVIKTWARQYPNCNWGGTLDKRLVIDVDIPEESKHDPHHQVVWPDDLMGLTRLHFSGRSPGGGHIIFDLTDEQIKRLESVKTSGIKTLGPTLDYKFGPNQQIVMPGSIHAGLPDYGIKSGPYLSDGTDIIVAPEWIIDWVVESHHLDESDEAAEPREHLAALIKNLRGMREGARNDTLTKAAGHLANIVPYPDAFKELMYTINDGMSHPLSARETTMIANSIWSRKEKAADLRQDTTDAGLIDSFNSYTSHNWIHVPRIGWFQYTNGYWEESDELDVEYAVQDFLEKNADHFCSGLTAAKRETLRNKLLSVGKFQTLTKGLKSKNKVPAELLDSDPHLLHCKNGVVDLRTGELGMHSKSYYMTKTTRTDYKPEATHPVWDKVLTAVPQNQLGWFQIRMGQAATGQVPSDESILFLLGSGANGKSSLLAGLLSALGTYADWVPKAVFLGGDRAYEMASLQGLRLAIVEELPTKIEASRLKDLTGVKVNARRLYKDFGTFKASHTLAVTMNREPSVGETDEGTWRRPILMEFPNRYVEKPNKANEYQKDQTVLRLLEQSPESLREATLAWVVEGAVRLYNGYDQQVLPPHPTEIQNATEGWRFDNDPLKQYVLTFLTPKHGYCIASTDIAQDFNRWLRGHGYKERAQNMILSDLKATFDALDWEVQYRQGLRGHLTRPRLAEVREPLKTRVRGFEEVSWVS